MKPTMTSARDEAAVRLADVARKLCGYSVWPSELSELRTALAAFDATSPSPSPPPTAARGEGEEEWRTEAQERADEITRKYMDPNEGAEMSDGEWVVMFAALRDDLKSIASALRERDERGGA